MNRPIVFDSPFLLGFEHTRSLIERAAKASAESYPPYNVEERPGGGLPCCQGRGIGRRVARARLSLVRVEHMKVAVHRRF